MQNSQKVSSADCGCERHRPIAICNCGAQNRINARHCRTCGAEFVATTASSITPSAVTISALQGNILFPPAAFDGAILAHTRQGEVLQIVPLPDSKPWTLGSLKASEAGLNRGVVTAAPLIRDGQSHGPQYLVATARGIEALSLYTGESRMLCGAGDSQAIAAIRGGAHPQSFCGVAAGENQIYFVIEEGERRSLATINLASDGPPESLLILRGAAVAGPLLCGTRLVYCTDQQIGLHDSVQGSAIADLPLNFRPYLAQGNTELTLAPGAMPLALIETRSAARKALVFGTQDNLSGVLEVDFDRGSTSFTVLHPGSSVSVMADGTVCLCVNSGLKVYGKDSTRWIAGTLKRLFPASVAGGRTVFFEDHVMRDEQHLVIETSGKTHHVSFEAQGCTSQTCCAAFMVGEAMVVPYFDVSSSHGPSGLVFAAWSFVNV